MKRAIILFAALLAGCEDYKDITSDGFAQGRVSQERFALDDRDCQQQAEVLRSYSLYGIAAEAADLHELYNNAYTACMKARGYRPDRGLFTF